MLAASLLAALLAACVPRTAVAHMTLASPKPFGNPTTSPLSSDGSNYPCQIVGDAATFYATSAAAANNTLAIGTPQTLSFAGSAVHGGGSCQLALTSDLQPSASTAWQVILSIEGGCPTVDGSGPSTYDYTIPDSIAPGAYVFAWTWISKLSGAPEYYMNCAPVTVTAGSGAAKRDAAAAAAADAAADAAARVAAVLAGRDDSNATSSASSSSALPNLFVANLASINSCKTTTSTDPLYPDPGPNVSKPSKMTTNFQAVAGTNCFPLGGSDSGSGNSTTGNSGSGNTTDPATTTAAAAAPPATASATASSVAVPVGSGTNSTTAAAANTTATAATTAAAPATTTAVPATTTTAAPATTTTAAATGGSSGGSALSGACTNEGTFNCIAGTQYQQCASGAWTALQAMPAGTQCQPGESTTLWARDLAAADYNGTAPDDGGGGGGGGGDNANNGTDTTTPPPATTDGGLTGACTVEGLFNCVGGTLYQQCAVGLWSTLQAMPAGTACQEGQSATLWARSAKRSDNSTLADGGGGGNATTAGGGGGSTNSTSPTPVDSGSGGDGAGLSGACSAEGLFNCVGGTQYQQCAVGAWSPLQAMPAGTACQEGQSATLWARRRDVAAAVPAAAASVAGAAAGPASSAAAVAVPAAASSVAAAAGPASSAAAVPVPASSVAPAATAAPSAAPSAAAAGTGTGLTGACATEGLFNCVGGTQYQQCAAGAWTALQAIPAGTACQEGESTTLWARDAARPRFHARRRRQQRQRRM